MSGMSTNVAKRFASFRRSSEGNVAILFTLALLPMVGLIGAAVDYSRANSTRTAMQSALDSTALMLSKEASGLTADQLNAKALSYFKANFTRAEAYNLKLDTPVFKNTGGTSLKLAAHAVVKSEFMNVLGINEMPIGTETTVKWGNTRLRVALALDNTGSMAQAGKMTALKTATNNLLNSLKNAATNNGDVYVSVVPFSKDVNVGSSFYEADWIRWTEWDAKNGSWVAKDDDDDDDDDDDANKGKAKGKTTWKPASHDTWNGCVTDRDHPHDRLNTTPNPGDTNTLFVAEQFGSCPVALVALTYDWIALKNKVDSMTSKGNTNQNIGLAWAWQTLSEGGPLTVPPIPNDGIQTKKVIILFTDGLNTQNRWNENQAQIDAHQKITCKNAKDAGIIIYTVQVNTGGDPESKMLKECATDPSKFFHLKSANQVVATFDQIGTELAKVRVAS